MNRRGFIGGLAGILSAGFAPAAIGSSVLMPVAKVHTQQVQVRAYRHFDIQRFRHLYRYDVRFGDMAFAMGLARTSEEVMSSPERFPGLGDAMDRLQLAVSRRNGHVLLRAPSSFVAADFD